MRGAFKFFFFLVVCGALGWQMNGMTYTGDRYCPTVAMGSAAANMSMQQLQTIGCDWVAIVATQYQHNVTATDIFPIYDPSQYKDSCNYYTFITTPLSGVRAAVQRAKQLGLRVMLKPHIDLLQNNLPCGQYWRGEIGTNFTSVQWNAWFASYWKFFEPYAQLAQQERVDMMSMNCELYTANFQADHWRAIVAKTRAIYDGMLTTATNWSPFPAGNNFTWWDALDAIGIDAYFPLPGKTLQDLVAQWKPVMDQIEQLSQNVQRKVIFTEIGFPTGTGQRDYRPTQQDLQLQATQYKALFEATRQRDWFLGTFWWNWETDPFYAPGDSCYTPQWKPAMQVLQQEYNGQQITPPTNGTATCYGFGRCTS